MSRTTLGAAELTAASTSTLHPCRDCSEPAAWKTLAVPHSLRHNANCCLEEFINTKTHHSKLGLRPTEVPAFMAAATDSTAASWKDFDVNLQRSLANRVMGCRHETPPFRTVSLAEVAARA